MLAQNLWRNQVQLGWPSLEQSIYPSKKERLSLIPGRSTKCLHLPLLLYNERLRIPVELQDAMQDMYKEMKKTGYRVAISSSLVNGRVDSIYNRYIDVTTTNEELTKTSVCSCPGCDL